MRNYQYPEVIGRGWYNLFVETLDAAKARNGLAVMVIVISLAEFVLVSLPWVSWADYYSLSGLETRTGGNDVFVSGYSVVALAAVACLSAILLLRRLAPVPIALVVVTGIATASVASYLATSDWLLTGLHSEPTWALYSVIGLGVVHALIGGVLASLYVVRRNRYRSPRVVSTPLGEHTP